MSYVFIVECLKHFNLSTPMYDVMSMPLSAKTIQHHTSSTVSPQHDLVWPDLTPSRTGIQMICMINYASRVLCCRKIWAGNKVYSEEHNSRISMDWVMEAITGIEPGTHWCKARWSTSGWLAGWLGTIPPWLTDLLTFCPGWCLKGILWHVFVITLEQIIVLNKYCTYNKPTCIPKISHVKTLQNLCIMRYKKQ